MYRKIEHPVQGSPIPYHISYLIPLPPASPVINILAYCGGIPHFAYPFTVDRYLGCFYFGPIVNNGGMNSHIQVFVQTFSSLECT